MNDTIDEEEVEKFDNLSDSWWDKGSNFQLLHNMNLPRLQFIKSCLDISDLKVLDVGCGGGLLSEPLARQGAQVTSIDPSLNNIEYAKQHSQQVGFIVY